MVARLTSVYGCGESRRAPISGGREGSSIVKFSEIVKQAVALLQDSGRVSYRALKREFELDDEILEDLKEELVDIRQVAADKDGKMLVWAGV